MATATMRDAVLSLSEDSSKASTTLRHVGALERRVFFDTLRSLNIARWAVLVHRFATEPAYRDEFTSDERAQARRLARRLVLEARAVAA